MSKFRHAQYICADCRRRLSTTRNTFPEARPPTAPKQHPEISQIRHNVELYERNLRLRNYELHTAFPSRIADNARKSFETGNALEGPRSRLKELEKQLRGREVDRQSILEEIRQIKPAFEQLLAKQDELNAETRALALSLPNLTSSQTPTDGNPKLHSYINYDPSNPPTYGTGADHLVIGEKLSLLDFSSSSKVSGWGFYFLLNEAALLEQALVQYALSVTRKYGWQIVSPPSLVYSHMADSCGFQPRDQNDEQQIWQVAQAERDTGKPKRSLIATAEIPLAGLHASSDIPEDRLPLKVVGSSRCYRAEAGARGVDTKGLYRVHEFTKVEMFAWTNHPGGWDGKADDAHRIAESNKIFDEMVAIQREILSSLGLPCRVLEMPSSDLGASAYRKIDIEAMFPSRMHRDDGWGEVTSVSICTDYQSRRLDTRILERSGSRKKFAHTLNGTAVAIPRVLAAILENGWRESESCVIIPEVVRPFMGGMERIGPKT